MDLLDMKSILKAGQGKTVNRPAITALREKLGVSPEVLGLALGVSARAVRNWERGSWTPGGRHLLDMALLGGSLDDLFADVTSVDEEMGLQGAMQKARDFMMKLLAKGPMTRVDLRVLTAGTEGVGLRTVDSALRYMQMHGEIELQRNLSGNTNAKIVRLVTKK